MSIQSLEKPKNQNGALRLFAHQDHSRLINELEKILGQEKTRIIKSHLSDSHIEALFAAKLTSKEWNEVVTVVKDSTFLKNASKHIDLLSLNNLTLNEFRKIVSTHSIDEIALSISHLSKKDFSLFTREKQEYLQQLQSNPILCLKVAQQRYCYEVTKLENRATYYFKSAQEARELYRTKLFPSSLSNETKSLWQEIKNYSVLAELHQQEKQSISEVLLTSLAYSHVAEILSLLSSKENNVQRKTELGKLAADCLTTASFTITSSNSEINSLAFKSKITKAEAELKESWKLQTYNRYSWELAEKVMRYSRDNLILSQCSLAGMYTAPIVFTYFATGAVAFPGFMAFSMAAGTAAFIGWAAAYTMGYFGTSWENLLGPEYKDAHQEASQLGKHGAVQAITGAAMGITSLKVNPLAKNMIELSKQDAIKRSMEVGFVGGATRFSLTELIRRNEADERFDKLARLEKIPESQYFIFKEVYFKSQGFTADKFMLRLITEACLSGIMGAQGTHFSLLRQASKSWFKKAFNAGNEYGLLLAETTVVELLNLNQHKSGEEFLARIISSSFSNVVHSNQMRFPIKKTSINFNNIKLPRWKKKVPTPLPEEPKNEVTITTTIPAVTQTTPKQGIPQTSESQFPSIKPTPNIVPAKEKIKTRGPKNEGIDETPGPSEESDQIQRTPPPENVIKLELIPARGKHANTLADVLAGKKALRQEDVESLLAYIGGTKEERNNKTFWTLHGKIVAYHNPHGTMIPGVIRQIKNLLIEVGYKSE